MISETPPTFSNSYRTLICHAILSTVISLYEVSVCWVRYLPLASFRFHLTMNTLALDYVIPAIRAYSGLPPVRQCSLPSILNERADQAWSTLMLYISICVILYVCSAVYENRTYSAMRGAWGE